MFGRGRGLWFEKLATSRTEKNLFPPKIDIKVELAAQNKLLRFTIFGKNQKKQKNYVVNLSQWTIKVLDSKIVNLIEFYSRKNL